MRSIFPITLLLFAALLFGPVPAICFETDQYNLPPEPLADIGDEVSLYVEENLHTAVEKVNSKIDRSVRCLKGSRATTDACESADKEFAKLLFLRSDQAIATELYGALAGDDIMFTKFGRWIKGHKFAGQPDRYKAPFNETIFVLNPGDYLTLSPTVKLYGSEFGIDKLEHFFQQGYRYFRIEKDSTANGEKLGDAVQKAIRWGQRTERTYYGLLTSGVYSNADLYANYIGMKFYQGLTKPLEINNVLRPPTLSIVNGSWTINAMGSQLLQPFIADQLNEALNPSSFRLTLVRSVRREVKKHACPKWHRSFPDLTAQAINDLSKSLRMWNGEDYGYTPKDRQVTIGDTCFGDDQR